MKNLFKIVFMFLLIALPALCFAQTSDTTKAKNNVLHKPASRNLNGSGKEIVEQTKREVETAVQKAEIAEQKLEVAKQELEITRKTIEIIEGKKEIIKTLKK